MPGRRPFTLVAALVFLIVGLAHGYRLVVGAEILLDGHTLPMWPSLFGLAVPLLLSWMLLRESRR